MKKIFTYIKLLQKYNSLEIKYESTKELMKEILLENAKLKLKLKKEKKNENKITKN